ncbi:MAG: HRDC domain-containing protein, partial [Proteobacteria bacterium]|nr:HRDC domain-containing protein [Pseudomonadota bacterium]
KTLDIRHPFIDTPSNLDKALKELTKEKAIAVDLESDSMYHFSEKVCLIQVAGKESSYLFDPLLPLDLSPLKDIFRNPAIKKVFHGADYDIRSLYRDFSFEVNPLFDTQIACRYLGMKETGLEAVLKEFFEVSLNKKYQKKDWSQRPLPEEMVEYAANDVRYLLPLEKILEKNLENLKRLDWVLEDCDLLSQVRPAQANHNPLFFSFKGAGAFPRKDLGLLEALLQLRKRMAMQKDKPPFKIFQNTVIERIVASKPQSLSQLKSLNLLSSGQIEMYGQPFLETIETALASSETNLPAYPRKKARPLKESEQKRILRLKEWKDMKAEELQIDPSLVLNKSLMTAIAVCHPKKVEDLEPIKEMRRWQIREFGPDILSLLGQKK